MKLKNKILSLIGTIGIVLGNHSVCSAYTHQKPLKVVFVGDRGKTKIISSLIQYDWSPDINFNLCNQYSMLELKTSHNHIAAFLLQDTTLIYPSIVHSYFSGADIAIFAFDLSKITSGEGKDLVINDLKKWIKTVEENNDCSIPHYILVGFASDLTESVDSNARNEIMDFSSQCRMDYLEVSTADTSLENIDVLRSMLSNIYDKEYEKHYYKNSNVSLPTSPSEDQPQKKSCLLL